MGLLDKLTSSHTGTSAQTEDVSSPEFMSSELDRALQECGYGLQRWTRLDSPTETGRSEARASVEPMDGGVFTVVIDERGFWAEGKEADKYPTLDDLVAAKSPAFEKRRTTLLTQKLEDVAKERNWPDNEVPKEDEPVESVYKDEQ